MNRALWYGSVIADADREGMRIFVVTSRQAGAYRVVPYLERDDQPATLASLQGQVRLRFVTVPVETPHIEDRQNPVDRGRNGGWGNGIWANIAPGGADPPRAAERSPPWWRAGTRTRTGVARSRR